MKFLMGLNDSYSIIRSNTLLLKPLPTVNNAYSVLCHKKQAEVSSGKSTAQPEEAAFTVKNVGREAKPEGSGLRYGKYNKMNLSTKNCYAHLKCSFCR